MNEQAQSRTVWLIGCGVAVVLVAITVCVSAILVAIAIPSFMSQRNAAERSAAESALRNVVMAAEVYRADNDGTYTGMTASNLSDVAGVKAVDGTPSAGQVGLSDVGEDRYLLTYAGKSGQRYRATVTNGSVEFDFTTGKRRDRPLP